MFDGMVVPSLRVQINDMTFVDYLSYHKINGQWLVTSKAYHREA